MQWGGSLDWWETPLSGNGYLAFTITHGSWQNDKFTVSIDCMRAPQQWERWLCLISAPIWVRIVADEFYEVPVQRKRPEGQFRGPFYRIVGSNLAPIYERFLLETGRMKPSDRLQEYLVSSQENEIHILTLQEPSFQKIEQPAN